MHKLAPILLSSSLLVPGCGYSLGLANIEVNSAMNQKFSADIPMFALNGAQPEDIRVDLADVADFERLQIERPYILTKLKFSISKNKAGQPIIHVSSVERMAEPYLNFVISVDSPGGEKSLRAYTVLLDPPSYSVPSSAPAMPKPRAVAPPPEVSTAKPIPAPQPVIAAVKKKL